MLRRSQEPLPASSTTAQLSRYLQETRISDPSETLPREKQPSMQLPLPEKLVEGGYEEFGSTPQLDLKVTEENQYQNMLRYMPNSDFHGNNSTAGLSVPNTFKHKSHPNARTKNHISRHESLPELLDHMETKSLEVSQSRCNDYPEGLPQLNEARGQHQQYMEDSSTQRSQTEKDNMALPKPTNDPHDITGHTTPSWMPPDLNQKWEYSHTLPHRASPSNAPGLNPTLDFLNGESNTFVHNPPTGLKIATPAWKRASDQFNAKVPYDGSPLHGLFLDDSKHADAAPHSHLKATSSAAPLTSTFSTPVASRDADVHLTQEQIHQLEDMLEKAKDQPDDYQIKGSPLKLFGGDYDTFTKAVLTKFVDKVRSNTASAHRESLPVSHMEPPKLKIKNFTPSTDFSNHDFLKNAHNLFAQIQKNAYKSGNLINKPSTGSMNFNSSLSNGMSNATSTPKLAKNTVHMIDPASFDEYSSFLTDFGQESSEDNLRRNDPSIADTKDDYTREDKSSLTKSYANATEIQSAPKSNESSYTFDEFSDLDDLALFADRNGSPLQSPKLRSLKKGSQPFSKISPFNEDRSDPGKILAENEREFLPKESTISDFDRTFEPGKQGFIKWKTASQLKLANRNLNMTNSERKPSNKEYLMRGVVKPGSFPRQYGNMVFDVNEKKWVSNDKENDFPGSLDSIEDLDTASVEHDSLELKKISDPSILKPVGRRNKRMYKNLEVSFQVPDELNISLGSKDVQNITHLSELGNLSFTQSNKMLVSLITGSMDENEWDKITEIDLSGRSLERVERLERYLPSIKVINLSDNHVKFISGLPSTILELNVAHNGILNITSFSKFHDLQTLNVSFNHLTNLSGISRNVHLTNLILSDNSIESLSGLENLSCLINLDISLNKISGDIDFSTFSLTNLQKLILSDNQIRSVKGIETLNNMRVLNLNENQLESISCLSKHSYLKKLLLKFNKLKALNVDNFPLLRVLRIDGNEFTEITGTRRLKHLQELSIKCQYDQSLTEKSVLNLDDVFNLSLSGNSMEGLLGDKYRRNIVFPNLNVLNLSALGLETIPISFSEIFPNVRELNLNFNKLNDLQGLSKLQRLKRLNLLSNNVGKLEMVLASLSGSRKTLKVLDVRLNPLNFDFYPYVFNPHELEYAFQAGTTGATAHSPIPLEALDDIENFSIHYDALSKSHKEWEDRDAEFFQSLRVEGKFKSLDERLNYETIIIGFFPRLKELDGGSISSGKRAHMESRLSDSTSPALR